MPPRKPVELKRRTGRSPGRDAGGRRLPAAVTILPAAPSVPTPPVALKDHGAREWQRLWSEIPWLSAQSDIRMVARLCQLYDRQAALLAQIDTDGLTVSGYRGQVRPHPLLAQINALETELRLLEQQAGLTPASRAVLGFVEVRRVSALDAMAARRRRQDASRDSAAQRRRAQ